MSEIRGYELALATTCVALALASAACGDVPATVGQQPEQQGAYLDEGTSSCVAGPAHEPEVDWEGYVENGRVPLAADRIRIGLPRGDEPGYLLFGSGPLNPPPTDPEQAYPCEDSPPLWIPGHAYTLLAPRVTDHRMRFRIWLQEPYEPWCALQSASTAQPGLPGGRCELEVFQDGTLCTQMGEPVSCQLPILCSHCTCDAAGCRARYSDMPVHSSEGWYAQFDIGIDGDDADGTVVGLLPDISAPVGGSVERIRLDRAH